jgi:adenine-specific DNA-methyltransferase
VAGTVIVGRWWEDYLMNDKKSGEFTKETLRWLDTAPLEKRQSLGQYMTPRSLRSHLLEQLNFKAGDRVLDPAAGTGEFLKQALELTPELQVFGWDIDKNVLDVAERVVPEALLTCRSALDDYVGEKFDFVIGNPPYFETKLDSNLKEKFKEVINGRPNIYALFFKVGIDALRDGGTLAFVVPPSMNAGAYFKHLRKYLTTQNHIVGLTVFNESSLFVDAQTSVQVIIVKKGKGDSQHVFSIQGDNESNSSIILCERPEEMAKLYQGSVSLAGLGYEAVTGTTVWNQHKGQLTNSPDESTIPLLYARNIEHGEIALKNDDRRPQYIRNSREMRGPAIVVNRIIGGVGKGVIKAALIPDDFVFTAENHLNVIRPAAGKSQLIDLHQLFVIIKSPETIQKARKLTGNTQLSAKEWMHLLPFSQSIQT